MSLKSALLNSSRAEEGASSNAGEVDERDRAPCDPWVFLQNAGPNAAMSSGFGLMKPHSLPCIPCGGDT